MGMNVQRSSRNVLRKSMALLTCVAVVASAAPALFAQSPSAAIAGVILDPSGQPAAGFKVLLVDVASNKAFVSEPSDAQGNYSMNIPVGGRYKLENIIADDGVTHLPVQDLPPISILTEGTTRFNVRFTNGPTPSFQNPAAAQAGPTGGPNDREEGKPGVPGPWYHKPGPIVGIVFGAGIALALALGGGGSDSTPSPSEPGR
jgi:hypothetical protein